MAMDLLDFLSKGLGTDFAYRLSGVIGESAQRTQSALDAALPLLVAGAARKAAMPGGASELLGLINRHGTDPAQLTNVGNLLSGNNLTSLTSAGSHVLAGLFGDRASGLWNSLAGLTGIRLGSATTVLATLAPLLFGLLRGHAAREGLGSTGLASLLTSQREVLAQRVPERLVSPLGWGPPSTWFGSGRQPMVARKPKRRRWRTWIIAAVAAILILFLLSRCGGQPAGTAPPATPPAAAASPAARSS